MCDEDNMTDFEFFLNSQTTYRHLILSLLDICKTERNIDDALDFIIGYPASDSLTFTPIEIIDLTCNFKGLERRLDTEKKAEYIITTDYGLQILEKFDAAKSLIDLLSSSKDLAIIYKDLLKICKDGLGMPDIEAKFLDCEELKKEKVFINYCVRELEKAGGICWHGNRWKTTETGLTVIK